LDFAGRDPAVTAERFGEDMVRIAGGRRRWQAAEEFVGEVEPVLLGQAERRSLDVRALGDGGKGIRWLRAVKSGRFSGKRAVRRGRRETTDHRLLTKQKPDRRQGGRLGRERMAGEGGG